MNLFSLSSSSRCLAAALLIFATACGPATSFDHIAIHYQPSPNVTAPLTRVTSEAVSYSDSDLKTLDAAGAVYLGEIELRGDRGGLVTGGAGPTNLTGRASLEAAARGATHYTLVAGDMQRVSGPQTVVVTPQGAFVTNNQQQEITARYVMLRIEPDHWAALPAPLRPQT
ncbi:MAG: hypothetical protein ABI183_05955 [Polyangiaceae bacterium]